MIGRFRSHTVPIKNKRLQHTRTKLAVGNSDRVKMC